MKIPVNGRTNCFNIEYGGGAIMMNVKLVIPTEKDNMYSAEMVPFSPFKTEVF